MREPWHKRRLRGEEREGWLARSNVLHMFSLMKELCGMHPSRRSDFSSRWTQTRSSCHTYSSDSLRTAHSFEFWRPRHRISSGWPRVESSRSICATLQAEGAKRSRFLRYAHSTDTLTRSTPSSSNGSIRSRMGVRTLLSHTPSKRRRASLTLPPHLLHPVFPIHHHKWVDPI